MIKNKLLPAALFFIAWLLLPDSGQSQETNRPGLDRPGGPAVTSTTDICKQPAYPDRESLRKTRLFLNENRKQYELAMARARQWLDRLAVDPFELRAHGIKGKKKLAEILDVYVRFYSVAQPEDKQNIMTRVKALCTVTGQTNYHDMLTIGNLEFKQDATSYLRVAYLMERFKLDTAFYREQIKKAHPRLNAHMRARGVDQRMAFHWYYEHFGLAEPFPLESAFQTGLIASRKPADWLKENSREAYNLTHEVFVPYKFGENLDADFFTPEDKAYLRDLFMSIIPWCIQRGDADLTAEFILCAAYLNAMDLPVYRDSLIFLLESQNKNGAWGQYEQHRPAMGNYVDQGLYLHTTMVVLDALIIAFDFRKP
ncbi:MAG: hypothetical protein Q7J98_04115 [Kiritimatiellia bacterium]|nr:hypothetical protein [Kiritimatiellia bacterium]